MNSNTTGDQPEKGENAMESSNAAKEYVKCYWLAQTPETRAKYPDAAAEHATHGPGNMAECDTFQCVCGNTPDNEGFVWTQRNGAESILVDNNAVLRCDRCGRVSDPKTGEVIGIVDLNAVPCAECRQPTKLLESRDRVCVNTKCFLGHTALPDTPATYTKAQLDEARAKPCNCLSKQDFERNKGNCQGGTSLKNILIPEFVYSDGSRRHWNKHGHCWITECAKDCPRDKAVMALLVQRGRWAQRVG